MLVVPILFIQPISLQGQVCCEILIVIINVPTKSKIHSLMVQQSKTDMILSRIN